MDAAHSLRHDCWSSQHNLYNALVGNQNPLHGAYIDLERLDHPIRHQYRHNHDEK